MDEEMKNDEGMEGDQPSETPGEIPDNATLPVDNDPSEGNGEQDIVEDGNEFDAQAEVPGSTRESGAEEAQNESTASKGSGKEKDKKKKKRKGLGTLVPFGGQADGEDEDDSDVEPEDTRELLTIEVETVTEAVAALREVNEERQRLFKLRVYCQKRRLGARRELIKVQNEKEEALKEYRRIICDKYDSQINSMVTRAERTLDRQEYILKAQENTVKYFNFGDESAHLLAKGIKLCRSTLMRIEVPNNDIGPAGIKSLVAVLSKCDVLEEVDLHENQLGPEAGEHLTKLIKKCTTLRSLNLHGCMLGPEGIEPMAKPLGAHKQLQKLNLRSNKLGQDGLQIIVDSVIARNSTIVELDLSTNIIRFGNAVAALANSLPQNTTIKTLDLSHNDMLRDLRRQANRPIHLALRKKRIIGIW